MQGISEQERQEMLQMAKSEAVRRDMEYLASHRHNPVLVNGSYDMDRLLDFLNQFNEFINHQPKPFHRIIDKGMKL